MTKRLDEWVSEGTRKKKSHIYQTISIHNSNSNSNPAVFERSTCITMAIYSEKHNLFQKRLLLGKQGTQKWEWQTRQGRLTHRVSRSSSQTQTAWIQTNNCALLEDDTYGIEWPVDEHHRVSCHKGKIKEILFSKGKTRVEPVCFRLVPNSKPHDLIE